ncbi:type IV secretion system protein VirB10 [Novosphingobium sp. PhB57]|uniref:TrbI/VirB10 family protein n=1 Tax=Novosphingobium sp. PhB57 TaxID=2485107 RepID=UPI0010442D54|nr:TrbI/VirB10 family protein [Novosphingobium sp. PhB57]TCU54660.1 type IV secretion system protein VirB10 [Novosphingobium sp. PhB57]
MSGDPENDAGHPQPAASSEAAETGGARQQTLVADVPLPAKVDPETLALRSRPPRAIRFKREVIVGMAGTLALIIAGTAWYALGPIDLHLAGGSDNGANLAKAPTEAISALPDSYDKVPKLGPPLPGDLGRAIVEKQRAGITPASNLLPGSEAAKPQARPDRADEERKSERQSGLFFASAKVAAVSDAPEAASVQGTQPASQSDGKLAIDFTADPNAQQRKADFVAAEDSTGEVEPHALTPAASANMLSAGSVIAGSLITGLRSDLPGLVIAQVTQQVFDSATGRTLLIPQGARLIGSYDSLVAFGQKRALVVWQRIVMPDGSSIRLDNVPATDMSGYAGLADQVDAHAWQVIKGAAISTLLGVGTELTFTDESDLAQAIRQSTQQSLSRAGDQLVSRSLQVQPTITIRPGASIRLVVHRDLVLAPWRQQE